MSACRIDDRCSRQFQRLATYWKSHGYPTVESDLSDAFNEIRKDIKACHWKEVPRFSKWLNGYRLFKYRQKNSGAREGSRGGWRFYALHDGSRSILYPIVVYPKKEMADASDDAIKNAIKELIDILESPRLDFPENSN